MSLSDEIKHRMRELGIEPKRSLGQNFLINEGVVHKIVQTCIELKSKQAQLGDHQISILEVGPGLGSLTTKLKDISADFLLLELDHVFAEYWSEKGFNVWEGDALHFEWSNYLASRSAVLVSNLPYQISSRLVIDRCLDRKPMVAMILMFQKEVAIRILAECGDTDYGMLSVFVSQFWSIRKVCDADPRSFMPSPQVASQVLAFQRHETEIANPQKYLSFLKQSFQHPRRKMVSNLAQGGFDKHEVLDLFAKIGLKEGARPHEVTGGQFAAIFKGLQKSMAAQ